MRRIWAIVAGLVVFAGILLWATSLLTGIFQDNIPTAPASSATWTLEEVGDGFDRPIWAEEAEEGIFVAEQGGRLLLLRPDGQRMTVLDLSDQIRSNGERGLLGLAFDRAGGRLYIHYSDTDGDTVLSRLTLPSDVAAGSQGLQATEEVLLQVAQPYSNHNGGAVRFGPDGYLYLALGDGGLAGDPDDNGQDPRTLLGAILRLDVSGDTGYSIPDGNPFADGERGAPEVWAYGIRNPWRMHFDPWSGDLWVADVGQGNIEEMTRIPAGIGGANLGWNHWEGSQPYGTRFSRTSHLEPTAEYDHDGSHCSITGGPVLRSGVVLMGDYCSGRVWSLTPDDGAWVFERALETDTRISSFGETLDGRSALLVDHGGAVYHLAA